jgi:hypothetical protein
MRIYSFPESCLYSDASRTRQFIHYQLHSAFRIPHSAFLA